MRRPTATQLFFFSSLLALSGCGSVTVTPGTGGGGGSGSTASATASGTGGVGGGPSSSSAEASSTSTGVAPGCATDEDCIGDPGGPICDPNTHVCGGCHPGSCPLEQYCDVAANACKPGCEDNAGCTMQLCNPTTHACEDCIVDNDCPLGSICAAAACVPGCSATQACATGAFCCGGACTDLSSDVEHCGTCNVICPVFAYASPVCQMGFCGMGACNVGHADCDGNAADGCEHNVFADGPCACVPGTTQPCYQGTPGSENVGPCKGGARTCMADGTGFGVCVGQVLPIFEICANNVDDDCDGVVDNVADLDGDGWTLCNGDCCELVGPSCPYPNLVNPGAFEIVSNGIDDDCDPTTSDIVPALCPSVEVLAGVTGVEVAKAMDLCQTTTAAAPLAQKRWGLIDASQLLPDGSAPTVADLADIQGYQTAILASFGDVLVPHKNGTMAALSTGRMRDPAHPGYVAPSPGTSFGRVGLPPSTFLAAHGGLLPSSSGCNGVCPHGTGANDGVNVRLTIRAPTNAKGFSYDYRFFTGEYAARSCSPYNDFYLALLQSAALGLPADRNIAFDSVGNVPSVNNAFFQSCVAQGCSTCPYGTSELAGTGFDAGAGAGIQWLTLDAPIVPGETFTIDLMVFDVSDDAGDSAVLLDNFRWISAKCVTGCDK